jgi:hypothetical protein
MMTIIVFYQIHIEFNKLHTVIIRIFSIINFHMEFKITKDTKNTSNLKSITVLLGVSVLIYVY